MNMATYALFLMVYEVDAVQYQTTILMENNLKCQEAIITSNQFYEFTNGVAAWCEPTEILRPVKRPKIRPTKEVN
tara:strand:+ start:1214 stop:1438 length:225 start_codon:yes stop_codon:yes gene_type:complete